jgi:hypothetical protein
VGEYDILLKIFLAGDRSFAVIESALLDTIFTNKDGEM